MNQARSPLGEVLARAQLARRGVPGEVASAGMTVQEPMPAVEGSRYAARKRGLDLESHRSRRITEELVAWADLIVTMERRHVIDIVAQHGGRFESTFTLPELAGYAAYAEPPLGGETVSEWAERITVFRRSGDLLGGPSAPPEVADPIGKSKRHFVRSATEIDEHLDTIFRGMFLGQHRGDAGK